MIMRTACTHKLDWSKAAGNVRYSTDCVAKLESCSAKNFSRKQEAETITDLYTLSRGAEIAGEFNARGSVPSRLYTEDAPTARGIFDHPCKTTFATQSYALRTQLGPRLMSEKGQHATSPRSLDHLIGPRQQ